MQVLLIECSMFDYNATIYSYSMLNGVKDYIGTTPIKQIPEALYIASIPTDIEKVYLAGTSKEFLNTLAQEITECASTKYGYNKLEIEVI